MSAVVALTLAVLAFLVVSMVRSIRDERTAGRSLWREFGLGLVLVLLFIASWIGQAVTQWQKFTDDQLAHGARPGVGDFLAEFGMSTFENWQSEFLQLFTFVVLAALYIHKGSAESKDGEETIEASLRRIEEHLGTLPSDAPSAPGERWKLPETPLLEHDRTD
jgi:hypothetical protein